MPAHAGRAVTSPNVSKLDQRRNEVNRAKKISHRSWQRISPTDAGQRVSPHAIRTCAALAIEWAEQVTDPADQSPRLQPE